MTAAIILKLPVIQSRPSFTPFSLSKSLSEWPSMSWLDRLSSTERRSRSNTTRRKQRKLPSLSSPNSPCNPCNLVSRCTQRCLSNSRCTQPCLSNRYRWESPSNLSLAWSNSPSWSNNKLSRSLLNKTLWWLANQSLSPTRNKLPLIRQTTSESEKISLSPNNLSTSSFLLYFS